MTEAVLAETAAREAQNVRRRYARRRAGGADRRDALDQPYYLYELLKLEFYFVRLLRGAFPPDVIDTARALEIGAGKGEMLVHLLRAGVRPGNRYGVDLLGDDLSAAALKSPRAGLAVADAAALPFADESFDLVVQSTVFTSILDEAVRRRVAAEMLRVLKPGGYVLWYDFMIDNPFNRDVRKVARKQRLAYFGDAVQWQWSRRTTVAPPLARMLSRFGVAAIPLLESLRIFNSHELCLGRKRAAR